MHTSSLLSFFILLHTLYVHSAVENNSDNYLPLALIVTKKGELKNPNQIKTANIKENIGFTDGTLFSIDDASKQVQIFLCPAESPKQMNKIEKYNHLIQTSSTRIVEIMGKNKASENCLFPKTFTKDEPLSCAKEAIPVILPLRKGKLGEGDIQNCGPGQTGVLHKFVYEVCIPARKYTRMKAFLLSAFVLKFDLANFSRKLPVAYQQHTVYEICYNPRTINTIYTKHHLSPPTLLFDKRLEHERSKNYDMMTDAYKYFEDSSKSKAFYDQLSKNPTTQNQPSSDEKSDTVETSDIYVAEKLVSPDDLMTAVLRKPTFHYINVKPMHERLVKLWNYMSEMIRKHFRDKMIRNTVEIFTGAFNYSSIDPNHTPQNIPPNVPEVWIKIIHMKDSLRNPSLVIVMKNEVKPQTGFHYDSVLRLLCGEDHCESFKKDSEMLNEFSHLLKKIRCCPLNYRINALFGLLFYFVDESNVLPISGLTDDEEKKTNI